MSVIVKECKTCVDNVTGAACHKCEKFSLWAPRRDGAAQQFISPPGSAFPPPPPSFPQGLVVGPVVHFTPKQEEELKKTHEKPDPLQVQEGGSHYKDLKIQPIEYIHANGIPFAEGCAIKYLTRWRAKGGVEDLKKARHFIDLLIELETR